MNLLFGSSENPFVCTDAIGTDFAYRAWEGGDFVWHEELKIFGKPVLEESPGVGFKEVKKTAVLVTLKDRDVHIWKYLEINPKQNFARGMSQLLILLALLVFCLVLSQVGAFLLGEFGYLSLRWYFRYPLFGVMSFFVVFFLIDIYERVRYEYKLRKALRFILNQSIQGKINMAFYRDVLEKIAICNDEERSKTAKKLLDRRLV